MLKCPSFSSGKGATDPAVPVYLWEALAIAASLFAAAFFAATETALTSLSDARTRQLIEESGNPDHSLSIWVKFPERTLSTILFGNTLAHIGGSAMATDLVARLGSNYAVAIATGMMTFVILSFCEVLPKTLAKRHALRTALMVAPILWLLYWLLFPVTWTLVNFTGGLVRLLGGRAPAKGPSVTGAEIEYLINLGSEQGVLDDVKKQLLTSVLEFADLLVREVMVPRTRIIGVERSASFDDIMKVVSDSEISRIPVFEDSVDNIVGVLYVKDLARDLRRGQGAKDFKLDKYMKAPFFVPELMKISRLLREFQKRKTHMAVVVDEFGGTSGLVTLEDVVEEIVGEIQDEYDMEEKQVKALPSGHFIADGAAPLREVEDALKIEFPEEGDYETLGGFLTAAAGKVPAVGSMVVWNGLMFTIRAADERRVGKVEIARRPDKAPDRPAGSPRDERQPAPPRSMVGAPEKALPSPAVPSPGEIDTTDR